jgi:hypothetical protein
MLTMDCWLSAVYSVIWKSRNRAVNAADDINTEAQRDSQTHALRETIETYTTATPVGEPITHVDNHRRRRKPSAEYTPRKRHCTGSESHFSVNLNTPHCSQSTAPTGPQIGYTHHRKRKQPDEGSSCKRQQCINDFD